MTRIRRALAAIGTTTLIVGGSIAIAAAPSQASVTTCRTASSNAAEVGMCVNAWNRANLAPMSDRGVITAGYEYCNIKKIKGSATVATNALKSHYGFAKGAAISIAAEGWLC